MAEPQTVTVRIAVAVVPSGEWRVCGWQGCGVHATEVAADHVRSGEELYWVTATLPIPEVPEIAGTVEAAADA